MHSRAVYLFLFLVPAIDALGLETRTEDFTTDPGWSILGNGQNGNSFGWSSTSHAAGEIGEAGGRFTRSNFATYYADTDLGGGFTVDVPFGAAGTLSVSERQTSDFGGGMMVGHFSIDAPDANRQSTGVGIDFGDYIGGIIRFDDGSTRSTPRIPLPQNELVQWSYEWEPDINGLNEGLMRFQVNDYVFTLGVNAEDKDSLRGAFNSFGFLAGPAPNSAANRYQSTFIDDVSYSVVSNPPPPLPLPTRTENFDVDPRWEVLGNGRNTNNFGWSDTSNAGGEPGEAGGKFTRPDFDYHYADNALGGSFNLDRPFSASGKLDFTAAAFPDFGLGLLLGHFDFNGADSRIGISFGNLDSNNLHWSGIVELAGSVRAGSAPRRIDGNIDREWSYEWNPNGGTQGAGSFTVTLSGPGGGTETLDLTPEQRAAAASFNAFGFQGFARDDAYSSRFANLFIDEVTYSIVQGPLAGDYDNSGLVDQRDLDFVLLFWGELVEDLLPVFTGDEPSGNMDQDELDRVLLNWGNATSIPAASVPEPSAFVLLALILPFFARRGLACLLMFSFFPISAFALPTRTESFDADPNWQTLGNGQNGNDFAWSPTFYAGGGAGEAGGRFTRSDFTRYYADTNLGGSFTIDEAFSASGTFSYGEHNIPDFGNGFRIGHFSRETAESNSNDTRVGIAFTDNSHRQGLWWLGNVVLDDGRSIQTPPLPIPANEPLNWSYALNPDINGAGDAQFAFNLNGVLSTIHLDTAQQTELTGAFDAFGLIGSRASNPQSNWYADMFIDDVTYSIAREPISGDYDDNGNVSQRDLDYILLWWGEPIESLPSIFTGEQPTGNIDQDELDRVLLNWGAFLENNAAAVPEPQSIALVLLLAPLAGLKLAYVARQKCCGVWCRGLNGLP